LSTAVIGGPTTYNPEHYQAQRQKLMAILPKSQGSFF
jgi:hypothetical protein